ncbi:MAG: hypothetical protein P4L59_09235 [Desulfosporosinus sp.]|nr:hypothetical protein [Desulfosporosinus sp.]
MGWKRIEKSIFKLPTRQDIFIISVSLLIGLIAIAFFALRS